MAKITLNHKLMKVEKGKTACTPPNTLSPCLSFCFPTLPTLVSCSAWPVKDVPCPFSHDENPP
jgi:hypothetical protein